MEPFLDNILVYIIFSPLLAAGLLLVLPRDEKSLLRWLALIFSLGTLALILVAWFNYDRVDAGFQFQFVAEWFPQLGSSFHVGADGISLPMLLLTGILTPIAILASFGITPTTQLLTFLNPFGALFGFRRNRQWNLDMALWVCLGGVVGGLIALIVIFETLPGGWRQFVDFGLANDKFRLLDFQLNLSEAQAKGLERSSSKRKLI